MQSQQLPVIQVVHHFYLVVHVRLELSLPVHHFGRVILAGAPFHGVIRDTLGAAAELVPEIVQLVQRFVAARFHLQFPPVRPVPVLVLVLLHVQHDGAGDGTGHVPRAHRVQTLVLHHSVADDQKRGIRLLKLDLRRKPLDSI